MSQMRRIAGLALFAGFVNGELGAQIVVPKTVPVLHVDQFDVFPSANRGMGGVGLALDDSLLDPWRNPARMARLSSRTVFGTPSTHIYSNGIGGGFTVPAGLTGGNGSGGAGVIGAVQGIAPSIRQVRSASDEAYGIRFNQYLSVAAGTPVGGSTAVGGAITAARVTALDGFDVLFGANRVAHGGGRVEGRVGAALAGDGGRTMQLVLTTRYSDIAHTAFYPTFVIPGTGGTAVTGDAPERSHDRTLAQGADVRYAYELGSGWRFGSVGTVSVMRHFERGRGKTIGVNAGLGLARRAGRTTVGADLIYEPIWDRSDDATNRFRFRNVVARLGAAVKYPRRGATDRAIAAQAGVTARRIEYLLRHIDHGVGGSPEKSRVESWIEWAPAAGLTVQTGRVRIALSAKVLATNRHRSRGGDFDLVVGLVAAASARGEPGGGEPITHAPRSPTVAPGKRLIVQHLSVSMPLR